MVGADHIVSLPATRYGQLLLAKLVLFVAMLALASLNRFRLTPSFERSIADANHARALCALRLSLGIETTAVIAVLGFVAWLGTLAPPATAS